MIPALLALSPEQADYGAKYPDKSITKSVVAEVKRFIAPPLPSATMKCLEKLTLRRKFDVAINGCATLLGQNVRKPLADSFNVAAVPMMPCAVDGKPVQGLTAFCTTAAPPVAGAPGA